MQTVLDAVGDGRVSWPADVRIVNQDSHVVKARRGACLIAHEHTSESV
jgi:hypothetical protein